MSVHHGVDEVIQRIAGVLRARYRPERIILFGSCASGTVRRDSDIDLLIVKETAKPFFQRLVEVRQLVSTQRRGYPFEPIVVTPAELRRRLSRGDQFFADIVSHGRVLYARS